MEHLLFMLLGGLRLVTSVKCAVKLCFNFYIMEQTVVKQVLSMGFKCFLSVRSITLRYVG